VAFYLRISRGERTPASACQAVITGLPSGFVTVETTRSPRFLGDPCIHAPLMDPGGTLAPGLTAHRYGLPPLLQRRLPPLLVFRG
jgi:hypothetical protein